MSYSTEWLFVNLFKEKYESLLDSKSMSEEDVSKALRYLRDLYLDDVIEEVSKRALDDEDTIDYILDCFSRVKISTIDSYINEYIYEDCVDNIKSLHSLLYKGRISKEDFASTLSKDTYAKDIWYVDLINNDFVIYEYI